MSSAKPRRSIFADKLAAYSDFASGDDAVFARRGRWRTFFRERIGESFDGRVIVEIGCSDAASLSAIATRHPHTGFVGLDWKSRQIFIGAERVAAAEQRNVALLRARAQDLANIFDDSEIDELLVFHPEPCDRPEERANRLITEPFLRNAHHVLAPSGVISIKTDHVGYYQSLLAQFGLPQPDWHATNRPTRVRSSDLEDAILPAANRAVRERFEVACHSRDFWHDDAALAHTSARCFAGETTLFERRFIRKRQPIFYFELRKRPTL